METFYIQNTTINEKVYTLHKNSVYADIPQETLLHSMEIEVTS